MRGTDHMEGAGNIYEKRPTRTHSERASASGNLLLGAFFFQVPGHLLASCPQEVQPQTPLFCPLRRTSPPGRSARRLAVNYRQSFNCGGNFAYPHLSSKLRSPDFWPRNSTATGVKKHNEVEAATRANLDPAHVTKLQCGRLRPGIEIRRFVRSTRKVAGALTLLRHFDNGERQHGVHPNIPSHSGRP